VKGIITNHDLMILQGTSPLSIVQEIEQQQDVAGLALARASEPDHRPPAQGGGQASNITPVVTEINDRIVRRVLEIASGRSGRRRCGTPGSPRLRGRREQIFRTDQDNALLLDDSVDPRSRRRPALGVRGRAFARESLIACGFPPCPAASWPPTPSGAGPCAPGASTSRTGSGTGGDSPIKTSIFFDFRVVHGDQLLGTGCATTSWPRSRTSPTS